MSQGEDKKEAARQAPRQQARRCCKQVAAMFEHCLEGCKQATAKNKNRGRRVASWNCAPPRAQQHCHELLQDVIGAAAWLAGACNACCAFFADGGESAKGRTVVAAGGVLDAPVGVGSSGQACEKEEACPLG